MAAVNQLWHRWVYAYIASHLHTKATAAGLPPIVEFLDTRTISWMNSTTKAEATISGPITSEGSPGLFRVIVNVFIVISSKRSNNDYDHIDAVGAMAEALDQCIEVKDAGVTDLVDVGTLTPFQAPIEPVHLKPTDTDDMIFSTVSTTYEGLFSV